MGRKSLGPSHLKAYKKRWAKENRDKVLEAQRNYRDKNKEKLKAYSRNWRKENREKRNAQARREYAKRAGHYTSYVAERADRENPSRVIRRLKRQFKKGHLSLAEFTEQVRNVTLHHLGKTKRRGEDGD